MADDTLLIIEDERLLGMELKRHFTSLSWDVHLAATLAEARDLFVNRGLAPLVTLSDMNLPDGSALDLLDELRDVDPDAEWIFLTGYGSVPDSVRALRLGAFDFLEKPCDMERLDMVVAGASRSARAQRRLREQTDAGRAQFAPDSFIGRSEPAHTVRTMLGKLNQVPFSGLVITGETGTGKGLAARVLHYGGSRREGPLVEINCAALPKELLESELFGHEAGAFTGAKGRRRGLMEQADGGTLFLDEISEMPSDLQAKLLKALEDRRIRRLGGEREITVNVQIIAASNRDLQSLVAEEQFRSDLYHRLSVFRLDLPPLRERKEDLEDLVPLFVADYNAKAGKRVRTIDREVWDRLYAHDWPGNVRELRNVVERCVLFAEDARFPLRWLQLEAPITRRSMEAKGPEISGSRLSIPLDGSMALEEMDRYIIKSALEQNQFNVTATARKLGTTRETLRYRIQKYGLYPPTQASS